MWQIAIRAALSRHIAGAIDKMRPSLRDSCQSPITFKGQGMFHHRIPHRLFVASFVVLLVALQPSLAAPAKGNPKTPAAATPAKKDAATSSPAKGGTGQAIKLGQFDDWIAYATPGSTKICYALSVPKERLPKNLNRDPGYLFVSFRPAEKVRGEIAVVMGYPVKEDAPAQAVLGTNSFELAGKDTSLFVHNAAEEGTMLAAMRRGGSLVVKASSRRGNATTDKFSLTGIVQALDQAEKACK
jgi:hypothetical protein